MKFDKLLLTISVLIALSSITFAYLSIFSPLTLDSMGMTGFAVASNVTRGIVNLTVQSMVLINFSVDSIEWGTGRLQYGTNVTLDTSQGLNPSGNGTNKSMGGNFTGIYAANPRIDGLIIENIGNVNVSLRITGSQNASEFIGGGSGAYVDPEYEFKISNNESNSCTPPGTFNLGQYYEMNDSNGNDGANPGVTVCANFSYRESQNAVRMDVRLVIPPDSRYGYLADNVTATAVQSAI